jgi:hypothetical protein
MHQNAPIWTQKKSRLGVGGAQPEDKAGAEVIAAAPSKGVFKLKQGYHIYDEAFCKLF